DELLALCGNGDARITADRRCRAAGCGFLSVSRDELHPTVGGDAGMIRLVEMRRALRIHRVDPRDDTPAGAVLRDAVDLGRAASLRQKDDEHDQESDGEDCGEEPRERRPLHCAPPMAPAPLLPVAAAWGASISASAMRSWRRNS